MSYTPEEQHAMLSKVQNQVIDYVSRLKNADGQIDLATYLLSSLEDTSEDADAAGKTSSPAEIMSKMSRHYDLVVELVADLEAKLPSVLTALGKWEVKSLHQMAERAFPYAQSREWFFADDNHECTEQTVYYCLPPAALAWVAAWKQLSCAVLAVFAGLVLASVLGRSTSRRRRRSVPFVLLCVVVDFVSATSLLVPLLGNAFDLALWAPMAGALVGGLMFRDWRVGLAYFCKEAFVLTDLVPLAVMLAMAGW